MSEDIKNPTPPSQVVRLDPATIERVAAALEAADIAHSMSLTRLVDGVHTYTLTIRGEIETFVDSDDVSAADQVYTRIREVKHRLKAEAVIAAFGYDVVGSVECQTCNGTGKEGRHSICRDCDENPPGSHVVGSFQSRVQPWLLECFGQMIAGDREERNHRFLEEALELVQSLGCTAHEAHQLVDYVYGRAIGEPHQEVGGTMVTLAALCWANDLDMHQAGETELTRIWTKVDAIRAKQAGKPKHSPLPGPTVGGTNLA